MKGEEHSERCSETERKGGGGGEILKKLRRLG